MAAPSRRQTRLSQVGSVDRTNLERLSWVDEALTKRAKSKVHTLKKTGNEMLHEIFRRFDKDVDFRLNEEEFISFLKALDSNWREHIVDIAWDVDKYLEGVKDLVDDKGLTEEGFRRLYSLNADWDATDHYTRLENYLEFKGDDEKAERITAALNEAKKKSNDEKLHEIFDRFDEDYDMVLSALEYGNLLATIDPECEGMTDVDIMETASEDFERYSDAVTDEGLTEFGLRLIVDYKKIDVDKAYLNLLVRENRGEGDLMDL